MRYPGRRRHAWRADGLHPASWDSVDSTNWWRDAMKLRTIPDLAHLHYGECLEIVVKRYQRWQRTVIDPKKEEPTMFDGLEDS